MSTLHACMSTNPHPQNRYQIPRDQDINGMTCMRIFGFHSYSWHGHSFYTHQWGMVTRTSSLLHEPSSCVHSHANERQKPELLFHTLDPWEPAITYSDVCREEILDCYFLFRRWIEETTVSVILLPAQFLTRSTIELWLKTTNLCVWLLQQSGEGPALLLGQTVELDLVVWVRGTQIWGLASRKTDLTPCCRLYWVS